MEENASKISQELSGPSFGDLSLPLELWLLILDYCPLVSLAGLCPVNKYFRSTATDLLHKMLKQFPAEIKERIDTHPHLAKLYSNRKVRGFESWILDFSRIVQSKSFYFLCLVVSKSVDTLMQKRYNMRQSAWVPYNSNNLAVKIRAPEVAINSYFPTMSVMLGVIGYLFIFDTSDQQSFWKVLVWMDYIIREKNSSRDYPNHYIVIGYVFPNKKREVNVHQGEYFARLMGMTYFEVDAENEADLDKVWPELFKKFSIVEGVEQYQKTVNEQPSEIEKKKKKSKRCETQ